MHKSTRASADSARRRRRKQSVSASFRQRKTKRREFWKRLAGHPAGGDGLEGRVDKAKQLAVIPREERRASGYASKGPRSLLTPEIAVQLAWLTDNTDLSVRAIAEELGQPPGRVRGWLRSQRVTAMVGGMGLQPTPPPGFGE